MNAEFITAMKTAYDNWVETDPFMSKRKPEMALAMRQAKKVMADMERDPSLGQTTMTKGVKSEYFCDLMQEKAKLVKVTPIGVNNLCFQNATWVEKTYGFKKIYGLNITGCRCGGRMVGEIHALNMTPDGEYLDITRDFLDETHKWFYPIDNPDFTEVTYRQFYGRKYITYQPSCRCDKKKDLWDNSQHFVIRLESEFEAELKMLDKVDCAPLTKTGFSTLEEMFDPDCVFVMGEDA